MVMTTRTAPCSIHAACGACDRMEWTEEAQLTAKTGRVAELLDRSVDTAHPSPLALGYRARISLKTDSRGLLGYHRPRTHEWVGVPACAIARTELNEVLGCLPALPGIPSVELRTDGTRVVLAASLTKRGNSRIGRARRTELRALIESLDLHSTGLSGVATDGRPVGGECNLHLSVAGIEHRISPATFFQVNLEANEVLVQRVVEAVTNRQPEAILDLYAGAGNLSFPLAQAGIPVTQIERASSSVADARSTAKRLGLQLEFRTADANRFQAGDAAFDLVIMDPPRAGAPGVIPELLLTRPRSIVYVSCNPRTLARDISPAREAGYRISCLEVLDMFPQTRHVETLCILDRT